MKRVVRVLCWLLVALAIFSVYSILADCAARAAGYDVIELTCGLGVAHHDCMPSYGAVDVAKIGEARLPIECARWGLLSGPSVPAADGNTYYHKIMCVPR